MRKSSFLVILILLIIVCTPVMAEKTTRILTAFKENVTPGENAALFVNFELLDSSSTSITEGREVNIPQEFRGTQYNTFSWILHGNAYRTITLVFDFYPMVNNNANGSGNQNKNKIKYQVNLSHQSTRIGNDAIASYSRQLDSEEKQALQQGSFIPFIYYISNIPSTYEMYYADYYQFTSSNSFTINNGVASITIDDTSSPMTLTYNFSTNTVAEGFPAAAKVCNSWNRYGAATVTLLEIDESASGYASGNYEAPVILTISNES